MKTLMVVLALLTGLVRTVHAHPIHTTLARVTSDAQGLTINVRTFADDFSASVARFAGKPVPADSSVLDADVARYVRAQFAVLDAMGTAMVLQSCGVRRDRELYWLCFRATVPAGARGIRIRNQMLTEMHADQVNIVQLAVGKARKTLLFTRGSAASVVRE